MSSFCVLSELDDMYDDTATVIGNAFGSSAGFPETNLATSDITELWLSVVATGGTGINSSISIDLGSSRTWDLFVIVNHNITSSATVTLKSGTTAAVADHTDVLTYRAGDMYFKATTARTDRYLQLFIVDATVADGGYISMGRILLGASASAVKPFDNDWQRGLVTMTRMSRSDLATKSVDLICEYFDFSFNFSKLSDAQRAPLTTFLRAQKGPKYWFFLIPDTADYDGYVVRQMSQLRETFARYDARRGTLDAVMVEEESRGIRLNP